MNLSKLTTSSCLQHKYLSQGAQYLSHAHPPFLPLLQLFPHLLESMIFKKWKSTITTLLLGNLNGISFLLAYGSAFITEFLSVHQCDCIYLTSFPFVILAVSSHTRLILFHLVSYSLSSKCSTILLIYLEYFPFYLNIFSILLRSQFWCPSTR